MVKIVFDQGGLSSEYLWYLSSEYLWYLSSEYLWYLSSEYLCYALCWQNKPKSIFLVLFVGRSFWKRSSVKRTLCFGTPWKPTSKSLTRTWWVTSSLFRKLVSLWTFPVCWVHSAQNTATPLRVCGSCIEEWRSVLRVMCDISIYR